MAVEKVLNSIDISVSGMRAHDKAMEVISSNIANARTLDSGQGQPYRRLQTIIKSQNDGVSGVEVDGIVPDTSSLQRIYDPGNPKADASGYIVMPNVQMPVEMMNLNIASRAYQANAAILKRYQKMVETTLELLR